MSRNLVTLFRKAIQNNSAGRVVDALREATLLESQESTDPPDAKYLARVSENLAILFTRMGTNFKAKDALINLLESKK